MCLKIMLKSKKDSDALHLFIDHLVQEGEMLQMKFIERWKQTAPGTFLNGRLSLSVKLKKEMPLSLYVHKMLLGLSMQKLLDICLMMFKVN